MTTRIIIDVDETLLYRSTNKLPNLEPNYILNINKQNLYIYIRNHANLFLHTLSNIFKNVYIYSASDPQILKIIFEKLQWTKYIKNIWGYDNCIKYYIHTLKTYEIYKSVIKLRHIGNFNFTDIFYIIDDRPKVYCDLDEYCNMYAINPFNPHNNDNSLFIILDKIIEKQNLKNK